MTRNTELLQTVMQYIEDHPEEHDQSWWATRSKCGTTACFAGWACQLSGAEVEWLTKKDDGRWSGRASCVVYKRTSHSIQELAARLLGLNQYECMMLFEAINTREMLKVMVKDLVDGRPMRTLTEYEAIAELHERKSA